jgi:hypothetical protein
LTTFIKSILITIKNGLFVYRNLLLYTRPVTEWNYIPTPKSDNVNHILVFSNIQANELVTDGFEDFRKLIFNARKRLDKGAVASCIYIEREFAHVNWLAFDEDAKNTLEPPPFRVYFGNNEACTADTLTVPKFRGYLLNEYENYLRNEYLMKRGVNKVRLTIRTDSISTQKRQRRRNSTLYAKARYLKILWWGFWKETPITTNN